MRCVMRARQKTNGSGEGYCAINANRRIFRPMGRRRRTGERTANGRPSRRGEKEWAPTRIKRAIDDALEHYGNALFGTPLGQLALRQHLQPYHVAAGQRWAGLSLKYHAATGAPSSSHSANLELGLHACTPDVDTLLGQEMSKTERDVIERRLKAERALMAIGYKTFLTVCDVCDHGIYPAAWEYERLRRGLHRLAEIWTLNPDPKNGR